MSYFGAPKIPKSEKVDKTPYTLHYPHTIPPESRLNCNFCRVISIDPGRVNFAFRMEDRFFDGTIRPIAFEKIAIKQIIEENNVTICGTYKNLTAFLEKFIEFYPYVRMIIIERQLPNNYQAVRISQHTISYYSMRLFNSSLLPEIYEVAPTLKSSAFHKPKSEDLKKWSVKMAIDFFQATSDHASLEILKKEKKKDDLADTKTQIEALFFYWASHK